MWPIMSIIGTVSHSHGRGIGFGSVRMRICEEMWEGLAVLRLA
jgi:hypothetical protein